MNTIDDLRATLAADAASVDLAQHPTRAAGVDGKIHGIRRRRQAGLAGGVAALAAIVGFGVGPALTDGRQDPVEDQLEIAGHVVPREIQILDFPYRFEASAESEPGDDGVELEVDGANGNQAVSVAVDDLPDGATATLRLDGTLLARVVGPSRLDDPLPFGSEGGTLTITVAGGSDETRVGLAAYERTAQLAPGLADPSDTVVFRDRVADKLRVSDVFAAPGSAEASFTVTGRLSEIDVARHCDSNGAQGMFYVMSVDDGVFQTGRCHDLTDEDPAGGGYVSSGETQRGRHEIRIWTTDRPYSKQRVAFSGAVVGVAAYRAPSGTVIVRGAEVTRVIEWEGRLWELAETTGRSHRLDADGPRVLGIVPGPEGTWLQIRADGRPARTGMGIQGDIRGGHALTDLVWPGPSYDLSLVDVHDNPVDGAILVYRPID